MAVEREITFFKLRKNLDASMIYFESDNNDEK